MITVTIDGWEIPHTVEAVDGVLGDPELKTSDVARGHADGSVLGDTYRSARVVTIPVAIVGADPADVLALLAELESEWPTCTHDEVKTLEVDLWGVPYTLEGQTRGVTVDPSDLESGALRCLLTFVAGDPSTQVTSS